MSSKKAAPKPNTEQKPVAPPAPAEETKIAPVVEEATAPAVEETAAVGLPGIGGNDITAEQKQLADQARESEAKRLVAQQSRAEEIFDSISKTVTTGEEEGDGDKTAPQIDDAPEAEEATDEEAHDPVVKSGFYKVQVKNFSGSYKDAQFDDDGVCERISFDTLSALNAQFPGADIKPLEAVE